jgi:DNA polymerase-3 subunit delta'
MIIGHQKQRNFLRRAAETKRFSHAYLFSGQEKLGKKTLALEWVSSLLGQSARQNFKEGKHPDLIFITPEKKEIQISQIRDLIWRLSLKPCLAPLKIAIIDSAHLMNQEAQTSLLKTLEEPKGETLLILISDKAQYLFPTILSRVQIIKFNSVKKEEIKNYLLNQGISEKETEEISDIALGRPGVALDLISDKEKLENFSQRIRELNKISNSPFYFRFQYVKNLVKEDKSSFPSSLSLRKSSVAEDLENIKYTLDIWLNYFRSILLSRFSPSFREAKAKVKMRTKFSSLPASPSLQPKDENFSKYSTIKIKNIINHIQTTKLLLSNTNINTRLALETLTLEL